MEAEDRRRAVGSRAQLCSDTSAKVQARASDAPYIFTTSTRPGGLQHPEMMEVP